MPRRWFGTIDQTYAKPAGPEPPGYVWNNVEGRWMNVDFELRQPALEFTDDTFDILKTIFPHFKRRASLVENILQFMIRHAPDEFWEATQTAAGSVVMYSSVGAGPELPAPGQQRDLDNPADLDTGAKIDEHLVRQVDAIVSGLYGQINGVGVPTSYAKLSAQLLAALAGSMVASQDVASPPYYWQPTDQPGAVLNQVKHFVLRSEWVADPEDDPDVLEGQGLLKSEVLTALAGRLKPHLKVQVGSGPEEMDLFALLWSVVNIVANRYDLSQEPPSW